VPINHRAINKMEEELKSQFKPIKERKMIKEVIDKSSWFFPFIFPPHIKPHPNQRPYNKQYT
jgi:hypothetical protein